MSGATVAYLRVSSEGQSLERQEELKEGADRVFEEKASAASRHRPQLEALLSYVREGDTVRVWSIDRLARSTADLYSIVDGLNQKGVSVEFVKEAMNFPADGSTDARARFMFGVLAAFAEFERAISKERQREGIEKAKLAGKYKGRKRILTDHQVEEIAAEVKREVPIAALARRYGVSRATIYNELEALKKKQRKADALRCEVRHSGQDLPGTDRGTRACKDHR